ncbi:hypothetical protein SU89_03755 [Neisseria meningitidis]|nr:hypothetical protein [Neisseria meningitidis]
MLKQTTLLAACTAVAALLGGCATQQPAPVIAGNSGMQDAPSSAVYNNPYGATPYSPAPAGDAPYVPPVQSAPVYTPPAYVPPSAPAVSGTYVPSYAPVDINAATHTIVRGDTVYNISKRYHISQDDFRAWNGIAYYCARRHGVQHFQTLPYLSRRFPCVERHDRQYVEHRSDC